MADFLGNISVISGVETGHFGVRSPAMSATPSSADHEPGAGGLVELESELTRLPIEYDELETA